MSAWRQLSHMAEQVVHGASFRILTVCTMNICRSPALEVVLARQDVWSGLPVGVVKVSSAGTKAVAGATGCDISLAMVGEPDRLAGSRQLTPEMLAGVDLVITADRGHAGAVVGMAPGSAPTCFTARAAARLSQWVIVSGALAVGVRKAAGDFVRADREQPATLAEPLPVEPIARLRWLVVEMDAARGLAPIDEVAARMPFGHDDIPDPHVLGFNLHRMSADFILDSVGSFAAVVDQVLSAPPAR